MPAPAPNTETETVFGDDLKVSVDTFELRVFEALGSSGYKSG